MLDKLLFVSNARLILLFTLPIKKPRRRARVGR